MREKKKDLSLVAFSTWRHSNKTQNIEQKKGMIRYENKEDGDQKLKLFNLFIEPKEK